MEKIKILRIIARLNIGGPAIHTILLTEGLDKSLFQTLLICGSIADKEGDMRYYAKEKNIEPVYINELERELNLVSDLRALIKIYRIIKATRPDIIHTHTAKAGALGRLAGILFNITKPHRCHKALLIHTFHGHVFKGYFCKLKTTVFIVIERFFARFSSKIITVSESIKKDLISLRICNSEKIEVVPLGFELEKFLNIPLSDCPIKQIGIIGRLVAIKNHVLFLDMVSQIQKWGTKLNLAFKIIGDGELRGELERYAKKLNITSYVEFLGWRKDTPGVYCGLDAVVLTSINEGTPVSLIEAMASGVAVISSNTGGVPDLLGKTNEKINIKDGKYRVLERGVIVDSYKPEDFSSAVKFIIENNELRKSLRLNARNFVKDKFTKKRLLEDMERLYLSMFNEARQITSYSYSICNQSR